MVTFILRFLPQFIEDGGYDVLKASIFARGLDNPPVLTRRPGDEKYMLASGGNTRLAILNELWQETQDERYHYVIAGVASDAGIERERLDLLQTDLDHLKTRPFSPTPRAPRTPGCDVRKG